jgi:hypothetical protein
MEKYFSGTSKKDLAEIRNIDCFEHRILAERFENIRHIVSICQIHLFCRFFLSFGTQFDEKL